MTAGRPSDYSPEFCEQVEALGAEGKSPVQIAVALGVPRTTMLSWAEAHPEFSTALSRAKDAEQAWWEDKGMAGMMLQGFNAAVWKKSMEARFRDDYTERREGELKVKADESITGLMTRIAASGSRLTSPEDDAGATEA